MAQNDVEVNATTILHDSRHTIVQWLADIRTQKGPYPTLFNMVFNLVRADVHQSTKSEVGHNSSGTSVVLQYFLSQSFHFSSSMVPAATYLPPSPSSLSLPSSPSYAIGRSHRICRLTASTVDMESEKWDAV